MFSLSGLLLLFPFYVTTIAGTQIARRVRGHRDEVDQLAKEHYDLWLEEQLAKDRSGIHRELSAATPAE